MLKIPLRIYIVLSLLLAIMVIIITYKATPATKMLSYKTSEIIEESMTGVQARRFDSDGRLMQKITMGSWLHHQGQTVTQMKEPTLKVYHPDGGIWDISAQAGTGVQTQINGKLETLQLSQDVTVLRLSPDSNSWWELKTQHLMYLPQNLTVQTDDPVIVNGPGLKIHATGMVSSLNKHSIDFLKEVKTQYVTPQS